MKKISYTLPRRVSQAGVKRWLSGTLEVLPKPIEPWQVQEGKKWAQGASEEEYWVERRRDDGTEVNEIQKYLRAGEAVIVDEALEDCLGTYAEMLVDVKSEMARAGSSEKQGITRLKQIEDNFLVKYPDPEHMEGLEKIAQYGLRKYVRRAEKTFKIKNFESWCYMNYPPDLYSQIAISELVKLRNSYRRYLKGVKVLALNPTPRERGSRRNKRKLMPYIYRPLHNVVMPHHSVVSLLHDRLRAANPRALKKISRVLDVGAGAGLSSILLRRHGVGEEQMALSDPFKNNLLSAKWNKRFLSGRKGFMVLNSQIDNLFPTVEDCKGNDFQLILHTVPGTALPVTESVSERCHEGVEEYLMKFLKKADMYLTPNGRIALTCDNFAHAKGFRDFISEVFEGKRSSEHNFEVEGCWMQKTHVEGSERSLENPEGLNFVTTRLARSKRHNMTGMRQQEKRELPPGPLREKARIDHIKTEVLGGDSKYWGPSWHALINKLGWRETNRLNSIKYIPEKPADPEIAVLEKKLTTRLLLLKRKTDSDYRLVDFGQRRKRQGQQLDRYEEAGLLADGGYDGEEHTRTWDREF
eukprot:TRINITY_DN15461_c0_g1_i1.p1 TRINITY_DN15461_c0_g1~~TRINITY_DN15461_c0_g1_i1.p1  ORF type:complete len:582 (+),score=86.74 TRINITY_DN15461_c0_g1_i1:37-1782(+)